MKGGGEESLSDTGVMCELEAIEVGCVGRCAKRTGVGCRHVVRVADRGGNVMIGWREVTYQGKTYRRVCECVSVSV